MRWLGGAVLAGISLVLCGCNPQQQATMENSAEQVGNAVSKVGNEVANKVSPVVEKAKEGTQNAASKTGEVLTDSGITLRVKTALTASDKMDVSALNVDTKDKVVYLKGSVPAAAQKALAETIAKDTVGAGVRVVNQLQVKPVAPKPAAKGAAH